MPGPAGAHSPTCCGAGPASPVGRPRTGPDAAGQEPSRIRVERPRESRSRPSCRPIQGPRSPRIVPCPSGIVPWTDEPLRPPGGTRRKCTFGETFRALGGGCREAVRESPPAGGARGARRNFAGHRAMRCSVEGQPASRRCAVPSPAFRPACRGRMRAKRLVPAWSGTGHGLELSVSTRFRLLNDPLGDTICASVGALHRS